VTVTADALLAPVPEPSPGRRLLVLAICCMSILIVSLDNTIVNIALPSIRHDLDASVSQLQWTVDAYTVVLASLLILSGSTADRFGRARVFKIGLVVFSAGSLLCSLAPTTGWLIAFRMVQAVGGSMLNPVAMSIIRNTFTDPRERAQAIGVWGAVVGLSMALGPLLGGALVAGVSWRAIFWVNVPVGLLAIVLTQRFIAESRAPHPRRIDPLGQLLVMVLFGCLAYGIIEGAAVGWGAARTVACGIAVLVAVVVFVPYERRRPEPLIDPRFFRSAPFAGATVIAVAAFTALGGFLFLTTLYLQGDRGLSAFHAGLYTLPMAGAAFVAALLSGRMVGRRGARTSLTLGGTGIMLGSLMLVDVTATTPTGRLVLAYLVFGVGFGMINPPITDTAVAGMPPAQAGVAAAIASTSRLVGISLGVALVGAIAVPAATAGGTGFAAASHAGWWLLAASGLVAAAVGVVSTTPWALGTARRAAALP
jgi:EmrB/QacA subfamily drug resistance transporter